jgi:hypothetical protein
MLASGTKHGACEVVAQIGADENGERRAKWRNESETG